MTSILINNGVWYTERAALPKYALDYLKKYSKDNYEEECEFNDERFYCYGSRIQEDDDSPFITELTTEGLAPLSYDVNKNKCIKNL